MFFSFFAIAANVPTRGHMIDFLVNLALNLALKIHQKSTQEAPKIYKKSIKNNIQDMIPTLIDFSRFWRLLGPQVGPMLRPCWPPNPQKSTLENKAKKKPQKGRAEEIRADFFRDPGVP